jgi:hypothetical protein
MAKTAKDQLAKDRETQRENEQAQRQHIPPVPVDPEQKTAHPSPEPVKPRF